MRFPRAIVHVDGDSFFAAVEQAVDVRLHNRPVVTGLERGIVSAATYDAKKKGVTRGVSLKDARKLCPEAAIVASDFQLYSMYAQRMYAIVRRYAHTVEEYGIDECFGDITGMDEKLGVSYEEIARRIKSDLWQDLRLSFSLGLAPTKVLAKLGSKHQKPNGFTVIPFGEQDQYLVKTPLGDVWGIGPSTALKLFKQGCDTALDFTRKSRGWADDTLDRPHRAIWRELNGEAVFSLESSDDAPHSIQCTRTFTPPSRDPKFILSQLSRNIEIAARKARREKIIPRRISFHLKSQTFEYQRSEIKLTHATAAVHELAPIVLKAARRLMVPNFLYRATGVTLHDFVSESAVQLDFWDKAERSNKYLSVYRALDKLTNKYGEPMVQLASSMRASAFSEHRDNRIVSIRPTVKGIGKKRLPLPLIGEV
jgi:nucleotidyltransferase/DNA polymerase involved in DNA repair